MRETDDAVVEMYAKESRQCTRVAFNGPSAYTDASKYAESRGEIVVVGTVVRMFGLMGGDFISFVPDGFEDIAAENLPENDLRADPDSTKFFIVVVPDEETPEEHRPFGRNDRGQSREGDDELGLQPHPGYN